MTKKIQDYVKTRKNIISLLGNSLKGIPLLEKEEHLKHIGIEIIDLCDYSIGLSESAKAEILTEALNLLKTKVINAKNDITNIENDIVNINETDALFKKSKKTSGSRKHLQADLERNNNRKNHLLNKYNPKLTVKVENFHTKLISNNKFVGYINEEIDVIFEEIYGTYFVDVSNHKYESSSEDILKVYDHKIGGVN